MHDILAATVPFFALAPCGYAAVRSSFLRQAAIARLTGYLLSLALACMPFRFCAALPRGKRRTRLGSFTPWPRRRWPP